MTERGDDRKDRVSEYRETVLRELDFIHKDVALLRQDVQALAVRLDHGIVKEIANISARTLLLENKVSFLEKIVYSIAATVGTIIVGAIFRLILVKDLIP